MVKKWIKMVNRVSTPV